MNYYNEIDPFAAAWLRELIKAGHIAQGEVDERDIQDIVPSDLRGFKQCHFFAGIGVWSYALRLAGWPDDREVWTGSCPCQPFSAAGKRKGTADERHLWPAFYHLIQSCGPDVIFGEQVSSKDGLQWFDTVSVDLENAGYSCGAADLCAAGFGAPHIRQRLYFVAHNNNNTGSQGWGISRDSSHEWAFGSRGVASGLAESAQQQQQQHRGGAARPKRGSEPSNGSSVVITPSEQMGVSRCAWEPRETNGFWASAEWIPCEDGKQRPVEPGTFPLAHGAANRVGRLRGYGNAIVAPQAAAFISAAMECL